MTIVINVGNSARESRSSDGIGRAASQGTAVRRQVWRHGSIVSFRAKYHHYIWQRVAVNVARSQREIEEIGRTGRSCVRKRRMKMSRAVVQQNHHIPVRRQNGNVDLTVAVKVGCSQRHRGRVSTKREIDLVADSAVTRTELNPDSRRIHGKKIGNAVAVHISSGVRAAGLICATPRAAINSGEGTPTLIEGKLREACIEGEGMKSAESHIESAVPVELACKRPVGTRDRTSGYGRWSNEFYGIALGQQWRRGQHSCE